MSGIKIPDKMFRGGLVTTNKQWKYKKLGENGEWEKATMNAVQERRVCEKSGISNGC
ncbi:hypothetical protein HOY82DRAFT_487029 [Tuber indicum]|nr:hypothetical protein HOY82DRAFT_487029 [Tuber indicum]